jgi:AcrR family transcriptional regulator
MAEARIIERVRMNKDDRRAHILDEALRIIGDQGYRGFSLQELAKRCGLSNAGLLHHFGSKDGLLTALLDERVRLGKKDVADFLGESAEMDPSTPEFVRKTLHAVMARNFRQPELVRFYAMLRAEALVPEHPAYHFFVTRQATTIATYAALLRPISDYPESTARQVMAVMTGLEQQWLREDLQFNLVEEWDKAADRLLSR